MTTDGKKPGRRAAAAALALVLIGLFGTGVAVGFWANNTRLAHTTVDAADATNGGDAPAVDAPAESGAVPDVRGLTEDVARQVLADSGSSSARVTTDVRPYAGLPGIVIEQQPAFGALNPETVTLTISAPAAVPAVDGRTEAEIRSQLIELGTQPVFVRRYVPDVAPGTVLGIEPAPGQDLTDTVTVTVADSPATAYVSDLRASENGCSTGSYTQAGAKRDNALSCSVNTRPGARPRATMWEFAGAVDELELTFGLPTDTEPGSSVRVEIFVDGRPSGTVDVAFGSTETLTARISGALQVSMVITPVDGKPESLTVTGTVRGSQDAIIDLTEGN
ncbi:PASTA domain-containing protein [Nocardia puris]|uniref:PASTA domain-containing protein n=1 Tax=Nocardia puris TaxID=208602 RepID=UPI002E1BDDBF